MTTPNEAERKERNVRLLARNSLILLGKYLSIWALSMLLVLFLPRYLGSQGLGQLQFAQSFVAILAVGIGLGTRRYLIKEIARDRSQLGRFLGSAFGLRLILTVAVLGVLAVITELSGHSETARQVVYVLAAWMVVSSFGHLLVSFLQGYETMGKASIPQIVNKAFVALVGVGVLVQGGGVVAFAGVMVAGAVIEFLIGAKFISRLTPIRVDLDAQRMKTIVVGGIPYLMLAFALSVYTHIDVVMLRFLTNEDVVGWHAAAFRIYGALEFLPAMLTAALLPTLSRMFKQQSPDTGMVASKTLGVVLLAMIPVGVGMSLTSRELIAFMPYPDTFVNTVPVLTLLALSSPVTAILIVFGAIAAAVDRQVAWAYAMGGTVILNITLNFLAIPYSQETFGNGGIGAAAVTLVSEAAMVIIGILLVPKNLFTRHLAMMAVRVAVCAGIMAFAVLAGKSADLGLFPLIGIGVATYGALAFTLRAVTTQDISFLRSVVASRKSGDEGQDEL